MRSVTMSLVDVFQYWTSVEFNRRGVKRVKD